MRPVRYSTAVGAALIDAVCIPRIRLQGGRLRLVCRGSILGKAKLRHAPVGRQIPARAVVLLVLGLSGPACASLADLKTSCSEADSGACRDLRMRCGDGNSDRSTGDPCSYLSSALGAALVASKGDPR